MRRNAVLLLWAFLGTLHAQQAVVTNGVVGTIAVPSIEPYTALTDTRIEFRLTGISECRDVASGYASNIINITPVLEFGCSELNVRSFTVGAGVPARFSHVSAAELAGNTDVTVRLQRDSANSRYLLDLWAPNGTLLVSKSIPAGRASGKVNVTGIKRLLDGRAGSGTVNIAWIRWYTGIVPAGSTMPKDTQATPGDLGNWEFEGNTAEAVQSGSAGDRPLNVTKADITDASVQSRSSVVPTELYPPVIQIKASNAKAGSQMTLDASDSFTYDGVPFTSVMWECIESPATPDIADASAIVTTIDDMIAGSYAFRLSVSDSSGRAGTTVLRLKIESKDPFGIPLYPLSVDQTSGDLLLDFMREEVEGATEVQIVVRTASGYTFPPVSCNASPCLVKIDRRQTSHRYQVIYKNAEGAVLQQSRWLEVTSDGTTPPPSIFSGGSLNRWATYLMQNSPERIGKSRSDASGRFFAQRLTQAFLGASRSPAEWNPNVHSAQYLDGTAKYPTQIYEAGLRESADARQFTWEKIWLHFRTNFSYTLPPTGPGGSAAGWLGMDKFDNFDNTNANGVLTTGNGSQFKDVTGAVWTGSGAELKKNENYLYIGNSEPFDEINLAFAVAPSGCTVSWEFWSGSSWVATSPASNTTSEYTANGKVMFTPNALWRRGSVNGGYAKWWMRAQWDNCSQWPKIQTVKGWDLRTGETNRFGYPVFPGFCESDDDNSRINTGLTGDAYSLEYEPNPPSTCRARFRWQARALGVWLPNAQLLNYTNQESGRYTFASLQADYIAPRMLGGSKSLYLTGVYLDSLYEMNTRNFADPVHGNTNNACGSNASCVNQSLNDVLAQTEYGGGALLPRMLVHIDALRSYLQEVYPWAQISANTNDLTVIKHLDHALIEGGNWIPRAWRYPDHSYEAPPTAVWDDFAPGPANPDCKNKVAIATTDQTSEFATGGWYPWDRSNRGPMAALAGFYVFANPCVSMFYTVNTPAGYYAYDDYYYWNEKPDTVLSDATAKRSVAISEIRNGTIRFESPVSLTPGSQLFVNLTSNSNHNEQNVTVATVVDERTVTTVQSGFTSSSSTGGTAMLTNVASIFKGDFSRWQATVNAPIRVSGISNGTVTLSAPMTGLAVGAFVYLEGADNAAHSGVIVRVATVVNPSSFTTVDPTLTGSSTGGTATLQNLASSKMMRIGSFGEFANVWKVSDRMAATAKLLYNDYPAGTELWSLAQGQLSTDNPPPLERIYQWGNYFPAMDIELGRPITDRQMKWKAPGESNTKNGIQRRDYEKAVVLFTTPNSIWRTNPTPPTYGKQPTKEQYSTYSPAIQIDVDGSPITVYPLRADGRTSNDQCNYGPDEDFRTPDGGCSAIKIRTAEGLVLMKAPIR